MRLLLDIPPIPNSDPERVVISPDGRYVAVGFGYDRAIQGAALELRSMADGTPWTRFKAHGDTIAGLAFNPAATAS